MTGGQPKAPVLEYREGGDCSAVVGLVLLAVGLAASLGTTIAWYRGLPDAWVAAFVGVPLGAFFALIGAGLAFSRSELVVDRQHGRVLSWWGLLLPIRRREWPLAAFRRVVLVVQQPADSEDSVSYAVVLEGDEPLEVVTVLDYGRARIEAARLARFVDLPAVERRGEDGVDGPLSVTRLVDCCDVTLPVPASSAVVMVDQGEGPVVRAAAPGVTRGAVVVTGGMLVLALAVASTIVVPAWALISPATGTPYVLRWLFLPFFTAFGLAPFGMFLALVAEMFTSESAAVVDGRLVVTRSSPVSTNETTVAVDDVMDVVVDEGRVTVIGTTSVVTMGRHLDDEVRTALCNAVRNLLLVSTPGSCPREPSGTASLDTLR